MLLFGFWQMCALAGQVLAVSLARAGHGGPAEILSKASLAVAFGSALWVLTRPQLTRTSRNTAVVALGVVPTLMWHAIDPLLFTGFDEQLHVRTLDDIISSHHLFEPNPLLEVSARYPGLEAVTVLVHQLGIPTMVAAVIVILVARVVLVTVLCDAVEQMVGNVRAGGLAVAVYATSPQFVFFNSQFSYQTLALPFALAAVSLIARSRKANDPLPYFGGATVCLLGLAITHHVASFITAAFLLVWAAAEKGPARTRVAYGALVAIAATLAWAIVQRSLLQNYFGPIIDDLGAQFGGGARRKPFEDKAGTASSTGDQVLLIYYAATLSLVVLMQLWLSFRYWRQGERKLLSWSPDFLLLVIAGVIPVVLAARVVPSGGQLFDRMSSFLFLGLSAVVANYAIRLWWDKPLEEQPLHQGRRTRAARFAAIVLASGAFLGGYTLGSGPSWIHLPGPYMAAADGRSMDAETLAAVKWARALPAGSRIAADRVSSILLASRAGLWPVMKGPGVIDAPALYVAPSWGVTETDMAGAMRLRYLYVDQRLADELPHFDSYFFSGETGAGHQLTNAQLTKFDGVPGIDLVYRHGPVSIYDLQHLGISELRSGWYESTPHVGVPRQLAVGLWSGLLIALVMRSRHWPRIAKSAARLRRAWGVALTAATVLASASLVSVMLLIAGVWVTPLTVLSAALVIVLTNLPASASMARRVATATNWRRVRTAALVAVPLTMITAVAIYDAATEDATKVVQILDDPTAVHLPPKPEPN